MEALEEPVGAGGFAEGWGGDADYFELPLAELGLVEMEPVKGSVDRGEGGQAGDSALGGGCGGHQLASGFEVGLGRTVELRSITHPFR